MSIQRYYIKQGYALIASDDVTDDHWIGGKPYHSGAVCPVCKIPLLLLADLNCSLFRRNETAKLFHELEMLPLYYCWRCSAQELSYRVIDPKQIKIFANKGKREKKGFPYKGYPDHFPRRSAEIVPIPYETAKLLLLAQEAGEDWLDENDRQIIKKALPKFRHPDFNPNVMNRHQIGGFLYLIQGHEDVGCPNPTCQAHKDFNDGFVGRMQELAVIHNDPISGLPMIETADSPITGHIDESVQVIYWICEECLTLSVSNRCD